MKTWSYNYLVSDHFGKVIAESIPIISVLPVLLVIPNLVSFQVSRSFKETMIISAVFDLLLSIVLDSAPRAL